MKQPRAINKLGRVKVVDITQDDVQNKNLGSVLRRKVYVIAFGIFQRFVKTFSERL